MLREDIIRKLQSDSTNFDDSSLYGELAIAHHLTKDATLELATLYTGVIVDEALGQEYSSPRIYVDVPVILRNDKGESITMKHSFVSINCDDGNVLIDLHSPLHYVKDESFLKLDGNITIEYGAGVDEKTIVWSLSDEQNVGIGYAPKTDFMPEYDNYQDRMYYQNSFLEKLRNTILQNENLSRLNKQRAEYVFETIHNVCTNDELSIQEIREAYDDIANDGALNRFCTNEIAPLLHKTNVELTDDMALNGLRIVELMMSKPYSASCPTRVFVLSNDEEQHDLSHNANSAVTPSTPRM